MDELVLKERGDTLIALAIMFERRSNRETTQAISIWDMVRRSLDGFDPNRVDALMERATELGRWPEARRNEWLAQRFDNIVRRGRSSKLDTNIHPEQIARVLRFEPPSIRRNILNYLPLEIAREVEFLLDAAEFALGEVGDRPDPPVEIIELIKRQFLSNFVQVESVHDANAIDELGKAELLEFIHQLGVREIAVACRGIPSKETLAAFFCRFAEEDAKAIATHLSTLERIDARWVTSADDRVKRLWNRRLRTRQILHRIGLDILAIVFAQRTETAVRYTAQKLAYRDSVRWRNMITESKSRLAVAGDDEIALERKRFEGVRNAAERFGEKRTV